MTAACQKTHLLRVLEVFEEGVLVPARREIGVSDYDTYHVTPLFLLAAV